METVIPPPPVPITGYRTLSPAEVALINEGKALAELVGAWIDKVKAHPDVGTMLLDPNSFVVDHRWVAIGTTGLQQGFMAAIRSIARPTTF